jgi:hypothetical protein
VKRWEWFLYGVISVAAICLIIIAAWEILQ